MQKRDYIEAKQHGTQDFPIQYYFLEQGRPRYAMPLHWHKETEIIRVISGSLLMFVNNVEFSLKAGDILLVDGGSLLSGEPLDCVYECIVFDLNMLKHHQNYVADKFINPIIELKSGITCLIKTDDGEICNTVSQLFEKMRDQTPFFELEVYSLLFKMFFHLYSENRIKSQVESFYGNKAKSIASLMEWIEGNFSSAITLDKLSEVSGFNKKYLCKIFKEYTSKTTGEYITELRIENACCELSYGKSVTEAAFDSGFDDLSYFCKIFKKIKGVTPNEFKKQQVLKTLQKG